VFVVTSPNSNLRLRNTSTYEKYDKRTDDFRKKAHEEKFGPTRSADGYWRIKTNQEINDILKGQNIVGFIKKQRLNWLGHVERMAEDNNVQKIKRLETHV
jgi:hypothetical protein